MVSSITSLVLVEMVGKKPQELEIGYYARGDFVSKIRELEEFWRRRAETAKQLPGGKSNVTPIFGRGIPENQLN